MHEIYTHPNSQAQFKRAAKVIPSGVYGHRPESDNGSVFCLVLRNNAI